VLSKKYFKLAVIFIILILGFVFYKLFSFKNTPYAGDFKSENKKITISDDGLEYELNNIKQETIAELLEDKKIIINSGDFIFPERDNKAYSGMRIIIEKNKSVSILADGKTIKGNTLGNDVAMALWDNGVKLGEDDFTQPALESSLKDKGKIEVIRVDIKEELVKKEIDFEKQIAEDDKLSWRTKKVSQKGVKGIDEYKYKVISHNGKEISRKLLSKERIKDPTPEISVQGTYMKLGKGNSGQGTWYAWKGGMFAASTTIPRGGYAKVTNTENGKTVVVQINDYGPQGKGRIIDLDKVAFEKIASLGAGVIGVKVEQILN
jgi:rare lipoprotein A